MFIGARRYSCPPHADLVRSPQLYLSNARLIYPLDPYLGVFPACGGVGPSDHFPFAG
jgi:hypothetical protein